MTSHCSIPKPVTHNIFRPSASSKVRSVNFLAVVEILLKNRNQLYKVAYQGKIYFSTIVICLVVMKTHYRGSDEPPNGSILQAIYDFNRKPPNYKSFNVIRKCFHALISVISGQTSTKHPISKSDHKRSQLV